jgi:hypothetical protein
MRGVCLRDHILWVSANTFKSATGSIMSFRPLAVKTIIFVRCILLLKIENQFGRGWSNLGQRLIQSANDNGPEMIEEISR